MAASRQQIRRLLAEDAAPNEAKRQLAEDAARLYDEGWSIRQGADALDD